jgi:hypothetical protein
MQIQRESGLAAKAFIRVICVICGQKDRRPAAGVQQGDPTADVADVADVDLEESGFGAKAFI